MKYYLSFLIICFSASLGFGQPVGIPVQPPPIPMQPPSMNGKAVIYKDSVQFKEAFKELYPLIKPTPNVKERVETMFDRMSHMFKARGIDSAKAYDSVMKTINPSMDEKILFDAYRAEFSAEELKPLIGFFKTPAGKHYLEVEPRLMGVRSQIDQYVAHTINMVIMPMGKPMPGMPSQAGVRRLPMPGNPTGAPPMPGSGTQTPRPTKE